MSEAPGFDRSDASDRGLGGPKTRGVLWELSRVVALRRRWSPATTILVVLALLFLLAGFAMSRHNEGSEDIGVGIATSVTLGIPGLLMSVPSSSYGGRWRKVLLVTFAFPASLIFGTLIYGGWFAAQ